MVAEWLSKNAEELPLLPGRLIRCHLVRIFDNPTHAIELSGPSESKNFYLIDKANLCAKGHA